MRDYSDYIGIPFKYGGRTHEQLDCYGLVMLLYKECLGVEISDPGSPTGLKEISELINDHKFEWSPCELQEGALILFCIRGYGCHVGYYIGNDYMIHTWEATGGVTIERIGMSWKHRILGVYKWIQN